MGLAFACYCKMKRGDKSEAGDCFATLAMTAISICSSGRPLHGSARGLPGAERLPTRYGWRGTRPGHAALGGKDKVWEDASCLGWPGQLVVPVASATRGLEASFAKAQRLAGPSPGLTSSCACGTRTTSCPGHPRFKRKVAASHPCGDAPRNDSYFFIFPPDESYTGAREARPRHNLPDPLRLPRHAGGVAMTASSVFFPGRALHGSG
jgi:hypothetical protein